MDHQGHQPREWLRWCCILWTQRNPRCNMVQPRDHCLLVVLGCQMQILFAGSGVQKVKCLNSEVLKAKNERICAWYVLPVLRLRQRLGRQSQNSDLEVCDKAISPRICDTGLEIQTQENTSFANGRCVVILRVLRPVAFSAPGWSPFVRHVCLLSHDLHTHGTETDSTRSIDWCCKGFLLTATLLDVGVRF